MCGIVYAQSLNGSPVNQLVWDQYEKQKSRGTQGFGLYDGTHTYKAAMEKRIKRWFKRTDNDTTMLLFHHRFPTSTINVKRAAHPFNTGNHFGNTRYVLVHNGVISNPKDLKEEHEKLGIKYQSVLQDGKFNDSEALLWDFALTMEGKQDEMKAYGGVAFICIKVVDNKPERMFFGRNYGRPLKLQRDKTGIMLSSEGEGVSVEENQLYTYNYELNRLTNKYFRIPSFQPYKSDWDTTRKNYTGNYGYVVPPSQKRFGFGEADDRWDDDWDYRDKDGVYAYNRLPASTSPVPAATPRSAKSIASILSIKPEAGRIQALKMRLLAANKGLFNAAYWQAESEYAILEQALNPTLQELRDMNELLEVVDELALDEAWTEEDSVHPYWANNTAKGEDEALAKVLTNAILAGV